MVKATTKNTTGKKNSSKINLKFKKEISKLPEVLKKKLQSYEKNFKEFISKVEKKTNNLEMGFYIVPEIKYVNSVPQNDFEEVTIYLLLDDFEKPIFQFNPKILLGKDFDKLIIEEIVKSEDNEKVIYRLKDNKKIKFNGISVSMIRENCFDGNYKDLQIIGNSIIYSDKRGFITALKTIDIHKNLLLQKFEKYIVVYAGAGSWLRGEKSNDFDVFIVIDDTDVKRMPRMQVKEQLINIVWNMVAEVSTITDLRIHPQVYLLTDFWDALKDAHPVMFTFLRDGVPFYDRGIYSAWKELLKLGKIRPSSEAIDMHMNVGLQLLEKAKNALPNIFMDDIYNAILFPAQALLMLKGYNPTTPKETFKMFDSILYKKEKIISKKDVDILTNTIKLFKKLEHSKDSVNFKGQDLDKYVKDGEYFLNKIKNIFETISEERLKESVLTIYSEIVNQIRSLPGYNELNNKDIFKKFEKDYIKTGIMPPFVKKYLNHLIKAKEDYELNKLKSTEVHQVLKQGRNILSEIKNYKTAQFSESYHKKRYIISYDKNKVAEIFSILNKIYLFNTTNNSYYALENNKKIEIDKIDFNKEFDILELNENLIEKIKTLLKTDKIYLS